MEKYTEYCLDFWGNIVPLRKAFRCSKCKTTITIPFETDTCPKCGKKLNTEKD